MPKHCDVGIMTCTRLELKYFIILIFYYFDILLFCCEYSSFQNIHILLCGLRKKRQFKYFVTSDCTEKCYYYWLEFQVQMYSPDSFI